MLHVEHLPTDQLHGRPGNRVITAKDAEVMAEALNASGLLAPLVVKPRPAGEGGGWELVGGHRRLAGARRLGWVSIPCVVLRSDVDSALLAAAENTARKALHFWQLCEAANELLGSRPVKDVSAALGISATHLRNLARVKENLIPGAWERCKAEGSAANSKWYIALAGRQPAAQRAILAGESLDKVIDAGRGKPSRADIVKTRKGLTATDIRARVIDWVMGDGPWPV